MKVHSGGTQLKLATAQAANLRIHIMVHSGVKPNKCDQCNFSTHKTGILRKHMKVISGEKSNKCHPCKFSTTQAANLRIHIWKHHGENPKKCYLYRLNSVFTMRCQIQETHQRIHIEPEIILFASVGKEQMQECMELAIYMRIYD